MKLALALVLLAGCGGADAPTDAGGVEPSYAAPDGGSWWHPGAHTRRSSGICRTRPPDNTRDVGVYDLDGFNNFRRRGERAARAGSEGRLLHGRRLVRARPSRLGELPRSLEGQGRVSGWPGEYWLDVRPSGPDYATLQSILTARFALCAHKGFDAVEADNIDSYINEPGFPTTADDQLAFDEWIATTVHGPSGWRWCRRTTSTRSPQLEPYFDAALDEQCNQYGECGNAPALRHGRQARVERRVLGQRRDDGEVLRERRLRRPRRRALRPRARRQDVRAVARTTWAGPD